MEFRSYPLTGAKQNFQIPYLPDTRMPNIDSCHIYNFNGQFQDTEKSPIAKASNFLQTIAKLGSGSEMPFSIPCSLPYDSKKKFVNHKKSFTTFRENNFIKDSMENKAMNLDDGHYLSSKGTGGMSSTISSHIVGGFVGSKSQVNNGKTKACELGSFIFDVLNNMKWGRSEEKSTKNKNMESSNQAAPQQFRHIIQGSSHKMNDMEKLDTNVNFGNVISISNKDMENKECSGDKNIKCNGLRQTYVQFQIPTEAMTMDSYKNRKEKNISKPMEKPCKMRNIDPFCSKLIVNSNPVPKVDDPARDPLKVGDSLINSKSQSCTAPLDDHKTVKAEEPHSPRIVDSCLKSKICSAIGSRLRQFSECSVDSTDSESFIVFDDRSCGSIDDEEDDDLEEMDEEDENDVDDNYGCCSLAEANAKWSAWYCDEDGAFSEGCINKKVRFDDKTNVHLMVAWDYAYRAARLGPWEQIARDRCRFRDRILRLEMTLSPVLREDHREKIYKSLYS